MLKKIVLISLMVLTFFGCRDYIITRYSEIPPDLPPKPLIISFFIVSSDVPLADAQVTIYEEYSPFDTDISSTVLPASGADGITKSNPMPQGFYTIKISHKDYQDYWINAFSYSFDTHMTITMDKSVYPVTFKITDAKGPVEYAQVYIGTPEQYYRTDASGSCTFNLKEGITPYTVIANSYEIIFKGSIIVPVPGQIVSINLEEKTYLVSFDLQGSDGRELPDPTVTIWDQKGTAVAYLRKQGSLIPQMSIPPGTYSYSVSSPGYISPPVTEFTIDAAPLIISRELEVETFNVRFYLDGELNRGDHDMTPTSIEINRISDDFIPTIEPNNKISYPLIKELDRFESTREMTFKLPAGTYTYTAQSFYRKTLGPTTFSVGPEYVSPLFIDLSFQTSRVDISFTLTESLASQSGSGFLTKAIPDATITIYNTDTNFTISGISDSDGKLTLSIPAGIYNLSIIKDGYESSIEMIDAQNNEGREYYLSKIATN